MDPSQIPASPPPPGVTFNFDNPDNYKHDNIILHSVVLTITTIAVFARLYTRAVVRRNFGVDDWLALLSWSLAFEFSVTLAYATKWGFGMHIYDIRSSEILNVLKLVTISQKSYFPLILSIKLCILLGYMRIFKVDRVTRWGIWFGITICTIFYIVVFLLDVFRCKPVEASWNPTVEGTCLSYSSFPLATGIFNVLSDFYILFLPLGPIFKMNIPMVRRVRIASIFGLGLFTCIASILRLVIAVQYGDDPDQTYVGAKTLHWPVLEINIGLICPCIIASPALFDAAAPRSLGSLIGSLIAKRSGSQPNVASMSEASNSGKRSYRSSDERGEKSDSNELKRSVTNDRVEM